MPKRFFTSLPSLPWMLALCCVLTGRDGVRAGEPELPAVSGELAGVFTALQLAGAPKLHWTLTFASPAAAVRTALLVVDGPDTHLRAEVRLDADGQTTWRVLEGQVRLKPWLNGQLVAGTATVTGEGRWEKGELSGDLALHLQEVDLGELLRFGDADGKYVREATGRVEGTIGLRLRHGVVSAGESQLQLPGGSVGLISFMPSPGLLTSYVPEQVRKLYPGIEAIEMGRTPLEAKVLRLTFHPEADADGRSSLLRIEGRPKDPKLIAPLELDVNLSGPVESLVRKVLDSRLKLGGAK